MNSFLGLWETASFHFVALYHSNYCSGCRELIERIITLGFYYRELDRFAIKSRNLSWIRSANANPSDSISETLKGKAEKPSVYLRALANGIVEILSIYRSAVLHIEQKLLSETMPILATVTQGLHKVILHFFSLFFSLVENFASFLNCFF